MNWYQKLLMAGVTYGLRLTVYGLQFTAYSSERTLSAAFRPGTGDTNRRAVPNGFDYELTNPFAV